MGDHVVAQNVSGVRGQDLGEVGLLLVVRHVREEACQRIADQHSIIALGRVFGIDLCRIDIDFEIHLGLHEGRQPVDDERGNENSEQPDGERDGGNAIGLQPPVGAVASADTPLGLRRSPIEPILIYRLCLTHIFLGICARCAERTR